MKNWKSDINQKYPRLYLGASILGSLDFSRSLFLVYFGSIGFSGTQTGVFQAALFWTSFLLELPSGVFADRYGRKRSLVAGYLALMATFVTFATAKTFAATLGGFMLCGAGFAFISGAGAALFYDGLKEAGRVESHLGWLARTRGLSTVALGGSILAGGFIYAMAPTAIFWATAVSLTLALLLISKVPEPRGHEEHQKGPGTIQALGEFFKDRPGRELLIFLGGMALIEMACTPFFIFSQTMFHARGVSEWQISLILGGGFLISAIAQILAARAGHIPVERLVGVTGSLVAASLAAIHSAPGIWSLVLLSAAVNSLPAFMFVHTDQYIQDHCESRIRASLLSVQSFVNAILIGFSYFLIGTLSDRLGMERTLAWLSLCVIAGIGLVTWHFKRVRP